MRKVFADGRHNGFPMLVRWRGAYRLAFRNATNHRSPDGNHIALRSDGGETWAEAARFDDGPDDRDPQWLPTKMRFRLFGCIVFDNHVQKNDQFLHRRP